MIGWQSPADTPRHDWTAEPYRVEAIADARRPRVEIQRSTVYGTTVYHTIPAETPDQARAIAAATSAYCWQVRPTDPPKAQEA